MSGNEVVAYHDERPFPQPTIRHNACELLIASGGKDRCLCCEEYRLKTLKILNVSTLDNAHVLFC